MESTSQETTGREIRDALHIAETRRERKRIARDFRGETGSPLASDIRASIERGDWRTGQ